MGDFDGDGQVDLLTSLIRVRYEGLKGLAVQRGGAGGVVEEEVLYDERLLSALAGDGARLGRRWGGGLGVCWWRPRLRALGYLSNGAEA